MKGQGNGVSSCTVSRVYFYFTFCIIIFSIIQNVELRLIGGMSGIAGDEIFFFFFFFN